MEFLAIILTAIFAFIISAGMILASILFGPKKPNKIKGEPFECGMPMAEQPKKYLNINFYTTAILFIVFGIEIVFLYPWAIEFKNLNLAAYYSVFVFIGVLFLALIYLIKREALKWD